MRGYFKALLLALLATLAHAQHTHAISRRKTLHFGPANAAVFRSNLEEILTVSLFGASSDPFNVANAFLSALLEKDSSIPEGSSYAIRSDSYTDDNTGVTHVYARQLVQGVIVQDGDININIKDGVILSYGDSFYRRSNSVKSFVQTADYVPSSDYCDALQSTMDDQATFLSGSDQVTLSTPREHEADMDLLRHLYKTNCEDLEWIERLARQKQFSASSDGNFGDSRSAVLAFMMAATPDHTLAQQILDNFSNYVDELEVTMESSFIGTHEMPVEYIHSVPGTVNPVKVYLAYTQATKGSETELVLVWKLEVEMQDNWYEAAVTALFPHRIVSVVDWASDSPLAPIPKPEPPAGATYNVFAWGLNDPEWGNRTVEKESADKLASPLGWHSIPVSNDPLSVNKRYKDSKQINNYTTTFGNNVFAHEDWEGRNNWLNNYRPDGGAGLVFNYTYDPKPTESVDALAEAKKYINLTVTQLFYTSNLVHDLYYRYGFDEKSGNFQQHNFGRGGKENDGVIANAQDGSGYNNANFMTPPDGQNGRCRMYLWNTANPYRDGDLEAGIVIHELSHGLSTRLTGGPDNSGCLGWAEAGGMGEGWGDFLATTIRSSKNYSDYSMGAWAANNVRGIRNYVYSLNETVNPSTYKTLDKPGYWGVHAIGEVWAEILWIVSNRLIAKHGYTDTLFPPLPLEDGSIPEGDFYKPVEYTASGKRKPLVPKHGNSLIVQLVLNGMKLQNCRPTFFNARDAIIQADQILTGGENFCELWKGFSSRGLGTDAKIEGQTPWGGGFRTDGRAIPSACKEASEPEPEEPDVPGDDDDDDDF